jgi:hypothetical protein
MARGLCNMHYRQWHRGVLEFDWVPGERQAEPCTAEGCDRPGRFGHGLCDKHYRRWQRGTLDKPRYSRDRGSVGMNTQWPFEFEKIDGVWYRRPTGSEGRWELVPGFLGVLL